jgi:oligopeptide transport system ATP-binding protein
VSDAPVLLSVQKLVKHFPVRRGLIIQRQVGAVHAVDDFSVDVRRGETLGLVGESGSGKTTAGRTILQFYRPDSGHVYFEGTDLTTVRGEALRLLRRKMQMIFQDPYASLDPRMTVGDIISEPLIAHGVADRKRAPDRVRELLELVGLDPGFVQRYPHEFSGGQRQRIGIARAISLQPSLVVCDEPISALDVSIQAQVVNLLEDLQQRFNLTYIFIAHDLSMVRHISDRVAVMYLGVIMELTDREELYNRPLHPYTQALLSAVPIPDPPLERKRQRIILQGGIPSPVNPPSGCRFRTRCPIAMKICAELKPEFRELSPGHFVACHAAT